MKTCDHCGKDCATRVAVVLPDGSVADVGSACARQFKRARTSDLIRPKPGSRKRRRFKIGDTVHLRGATMLGHVVKVTPLRYLMSDGVSRAYVRVRWASGSEASHPEGSLVVAGLDRIAPVDIEPCGDCFRWAFDNLLPTDTLVHAMIRHADPHLRKIRPKKFAHAWIERKGVALDWQGMALGMKGHVLFVDEFYKLWKPTKLKRYDYETAQRLGMIFKGPGPWHPSLHEPGRFGLPDDASAEPAKIVWKKTSGFYDTPTVYRTTADPGVWIEGITEKGKWKYTAVWRVCWTNPDGSKECRRASELGVGSRLVKAKELANKLIEQRCTVRLANPDGSSSKRFGSWRGPGQPQSREPRPRPHDRPRGRPRKLSDADVQSIRERAAAGETVKAIADEYGVHTDTIFSSVGIGHFLRGRSKKLSDADIRSLRERVAAGERVDALAGEYKVSLHTLRNAVVGVPRLHQNPPPPRQIKISYDDVRLIRERFASGESVVNLAIEFGISRFYASKIVKGKVRVDDSVAF